MHLLHGILAITLTLAASLPAAESYSGSLTSANGGLEGSGLWVHDNGWEGWRPATIAWNVSFNTDHTWRYEYNVTVFHAEISRWILEVSPAFTYEDIWNISVTQGGYGELEINTFAPADDNPLMPDDLHGIRFDEAFGEVFQISFDSPRAPVWGDVYIRGDIAGGEQNAFWNRGFTERDPTFPVHNGSADGHVIVPDTYLSVSEPTDMHRLKYDHKTAAFLQTRFDTPQVPQWRNNYMPPGMVFGNPSALWNSGPTPRDPAAPWPHSGEESRSHTPEDPWEIPEPATLIILTAGGVWLVRRRRRC